MKRIFTLVIIASLLSACHSKDPYKKARQIYEQTMVLHDEVMPKMGEVLSIKHSLKMKLDSVSDPNMRSNIDSAMNHLNKTYNDMMEWMGGLQPIPGQNNDEQDETMNKSAVPSPDEMVKIQEESLQKIKELQKQMETNIQNGKSLLQNH